MKEASEESSSMNVSFDEGADVIASEEDVALLAQLFSTKEASEDFDAKDAKIKTLKNVTASATSEDEISKLASLWAKDF
jgi:dienelactone hydrolase